mmetsp:Transcript_83088/g.164824  ORF Transcript_83088/g.164824 Transcript_83088/m.164824 type:complete len:418 (-) Transcript_83088:19-1272(-)
MPACSEEVLTLSAVAAGVADLLCASDVSAHISTSSRLRLALTAPLPGILGVNGKRALLIAHLPWVLAMRDDTKLLLDLRRATSLQLPEAAGCGLAAVTSIPASAAGQDPFTFYWDAPASLDTMRADDVAEEDMDHSLLLGCLDRTEEGALRSAIFAQGHLRMQLRWFPEGSVLCANEGGCSLYIVVDSVDCSLAASATIQLHVGRMCRIFCHDFASTPQWGFASFCDLREAMKCSVCQGRVRLAVRVLEAPARFSSSFTNLGAADCSQAISWGLDDWLMKATFGAAAYVSPFLGLKVCPSVRILVGVGADDSDELVSPRRLFVERRLEDGGLDSKPLAVFVGAPAGTGLRFALNAGVVRRVFFQHFTLLEGFAGARRLLPCASQALIASNDRLEVHLEVLGLSPVGNEEMPDVLPAV